VARVPFPSARSFASLARVRALRANGSECLASPSFLSARASASLAKASFLGAQASASLADRSFLSARRCRSLARVRALIAIGLGTDGKSLSSGPWRCAAKGPELLKNNFFSLHFGTPTSRVKPGVIHRGSRSTTPPIFFSIFGARGTLGHANRESQVPN
jgi:hypothetical protein